MELHLDEEKPEGVVNEVSTAIWKPAWCPFGTAGGSNLCPTLTSDRPAAGRLLAVVLEHAGSQGLPPPAAQLPPSLQCTTPP